MCILYTACNVNKISDKTVYYTSIRFEVDIPTKTMTEGIQHFDCLIIGAGVCGIDAAYHVQKYSPWANYAVLERSANIGGTWDQIKYPGRL